MKIPAITVLVLALCTCAEARGYRSHFSARTYYGGGHHTSSHGGRYLGSYDGASHRGGRYYRALSGKNYGTHR